MKSIWRTLANSIWKLVFYRKIFARATLLTTACTGVPGRFLQQNPIEQLKFGTKVSRRCHLTRFIQPLIAGSLPCLKSLPLPGIALHLRFVFICHAVLCSSTCLVLPILLSFRWLFLPFALCLPSVCSVASYIQHLIHWLL